MADEDRPSSDPPEDDLETPGTGLGAEGGEADSGGDDVDLASLAAIAGGSSDDGAASEPPDDDALFDLRGLTAQSALRSPVAHESTASGEAAASAAKPGAAPAVVSKEQPGGEPAPAAPGTGGRSWMLPLAVGLLVGGLASALVLTRGGPESAQQGVPAAPVTPAPRVTEPVSSAAAAAIDPAREPSQPSANVAIVDVAPPVEPTPAPKVAAAPVDSRRSAPRPGHAPAQRAAAEDEDDSVAARGAQALGATPGGDAKPDGEHEDDKNPEAGGDNAKAERTMDDLLDQALSPTAQLEAKRAREQAMFQESALPATPSREDVTQAMTVLLPAIRGCAMGQSGLATAGIVVRNDGRVASVTVSGAPFAGTASGRCMEGVMRRARFPRFKQPTFRVKFPLAIQ